MGASKTISEPMVRLVQIVHLTSSLTPSPNGPNEIPHDRCHQGVPSGASKTISEPIVRLAETVYLSYINTNTISNWTERDSTRPTSPWIASGASKTISEPMVRLVQTVHLSYINTNTISKRTERDST